MVETLQFVKDQKSSPEIKNLILRVLIVLLFIVAVMLFGAFFIMKEINEIEGHIAKLVKDLEKLGPPVLIPPVDPLALENFAECLTQNWTEKQEAPSVESPEIWIEKQEVSPLEFPEIDETASWKTYRNEKWGFEVMYPPNWFVDDRCLYREGCVFKFVAFGEKGKVLNYAGRELSVERIGFTVYPYKSVSELWDNREEALPLEMWIAKTFPPNVEGEKIEVITFGRENYEGILVKTYKGVGVVVIIPRVFVQLGDSSIFELVGEVPTTLSIQVPTKYNYEKVFYQMLSTFRFLK